MNDCVLIWSEKEKLFCLQEIDKKLKTILHVYEKSLEDSTYDYKTYLYAVMLYVISVKDCFECELTNVIINLNSLYMNNFEKQQIRKLILECKHIVKSLQNKMG